MAAASVGLAILLLLIEPTDTYWGRWVLWNWSDIGDHRRFPSRPVHHAGPAFRFHDAQGSFDPVLTYERDGRSESERLSDLARSTATTALLVARRDTLLFEGYFSGYARDSIQTSFSVAKSITSLLLGIAIDEGHVRSLDDPVTDYLPELLQRDPRFERVTLRHLLEMKSGIAYRDTDAPWGDKPKAYYGPRLRRRVLEKLEIARPPGAVWEYNTYNPILLGLVLERASGLSVSHFFEERVWRRLGMEYGASWSVDGHKTPIEKMESGVNARAVDFLKLGRLWLRRGDWDGDRIVSESWIEASTRVGADCIVERYRPQEICYRLGWWIHIGEGGDARAIGAWGHLGQYVYSFPREEIVAVRFGRNHGGVIWTRILRRIAEVAASHAPSPP